MGQQQSGRGLDRADDAIRRAGGKIYHVVDPQSKEGRLAVTWFRKRWDGDPFFMGFQKAFLALAQKPLGGEAARVLFQILGSMEYSNEVKTSQAEIARTLGIRRQNVYRAIKVLVKEEILVEEVVALGSRRRQLTLNHTYAWKGKLRSLGLKEKEAQQRLQAGGKTT